jgi:threonine dehydrogenase-like Zn-dependent dehydrogenase
MKAVVNTSPGRLEWLDIPMPEPEAGQVRIRTGACAVCATDLGIIATGERTGFPAVLGHEWAGTVDALGPGGNDAPLGRRCVAENILADGGEVGFEHAGAYAPYLITEEANVHLLPEDFPFSKAALIEPTAVCVRAMRRLSARASSPVVILGDGPIGLIMLMLLARESAGDIVLVGGRANRLALAEELGATRVLDYHTFPGDPTEAILEAVGLRPPLIVEASGNARALETALAMAAPCGEILLVGDYGHARANFEWNHLLIQEIRLVGSNASAEAWPEAVRLAVEEYLPLERLISHRLPAECFVQAVEMTQSNRDVIKAVTEWE